MTIIDAVLAVMREANEPLSAAEVYDRILRRGLYKFGAKDPLNLVRAQMRRHSIDYEGRTGANTRYLEKVDNERFVMLKAMEG